MLLEAGRQEGAPPGQVGSSPQFKPLLPPGSNTGLTIKQQNLKNQQVGNFHYAIGRATASQGQYGKIYQQRYDQHAKFDQGRKSKQNFYTGYANQKPESYAQGRIATQQLKKNFYNKHSKQLSPYAASNQINKQPVGNGGRL